MNRRNEMPSKVNDIRRRIDELDDRIHDLLMERAGLVLDIGAEKKKSGIQVVQPDREIVMIRRLLGRHRGPLPREAVTRIWRELVGAVSLLQTGLKVAVAAPDGADGFALWDMAKDYFSSVLPMQKMSGALAALAAVREGEATFAVLPWPEDGAKTPWWKHLAEESSGSEPMRIVARLPLGDRSDSPGRAADSDRALAVARLKFEPSGDDRGFIMLDIGKDVSRARIVDKAGAAGLKVLSLYNARHPSGQGAFHLLEVGEFIAGDDPRLAGLLEKLECPEGRALCLGGYPVPPVYGDKVGKSAAEEEKRKETAEEAGGSEKKTA